MWYIKYIDKDTMVNKKGIKELWEKNLEKGTPDFFCVNLKNYYEKNLIIIRKMLILLKMWQNKSVR